MSMATESTVCSTVTWAFNPTDSNSSKSVNICLAFLFIVMSIMLFS